MLAIAVMTCLVLSCHGEENASNEDKNNDDENTEKIVCFYGCLKDCKMCDNNCRKNRQYCINGCHKTRQYCIHRCMFGVGQWDFIFPLLDDN